MHSPISPGIIRFGVFEADPRGGELRKSGARIRMQEQPFQLLLMLLERPREVVTREEIRQKLWSGDVFVDFEHGVNSAVARLRDALGDSAESPRYIETLPRRGYRFIAPVDRYAISTPELVQAGSNGNGKAPAAEPPATLAGSSLDREVETASSAPRRRSVVIALAAGIAATVLVTTFHLFPDHKLTEADSIVLADFANSTTDPVFDSTLRQALALKLGESPFLSIVSEPRMRDTLRFMGRSPDERIIPQTAREICRRLGGKAMLSGQISQLADHYYISLEAFNCATGDSIARSGAESAGKPETLRALDAVAIEMRRKLGESLSSIQKFDAPIEQATTTSLEALQSFSLGQAERNRGDELASIRFFQRAIELDPNFAMAYAVLGQAYANSDQSALAAESTRKAFERREHAGDQERFYISTHYYDNVTRNIDNSIQTYEVWQQMYPRDVVPRINLTEFYLLRGECDRALREILEAAKIDPNRAVVYEAQIGVYADMDRLDDAKAAYDQAVAHGFNGDSTRLKRYLIAFLENDTTTMQQQSQSSLGRPSESPFLLLDASAAAFSGRLGLAEQDFHRAYKTAQRDNRKEFAAFVQAYQALAESELGRADEARRSATESLHGAESRDASILAALALARIGDSSQAASIAAELNQRYPEDTLLNDVWLPAIRAEVELSHHNATSALHLLESTLPYDVSEQWDLPSMFPAFLRAEADLELHDGKSAEAEFGKILAHRGLVASNLHGALAHLGEARARRLSGDVSGSKQAYLQFFALWKNADPQTPLLRNARSEYSRLPELARLEK